MNRRKSISDIIRDSVSLSSGAQTVESSATNVSKSKHEMSLKKNVSEDPERNIKDKVDFDVDAPPATPSDAKRRDAKHLEDSKSTSDIIVGNLTSGTAKCLRSSGNEQEERNVDLSTKSIYSEQKQTTEKAFFISAPPLPTEVDPLLLQFATSPFPLPTSAGLFALPTSAGLFTLPTAAGPFTLPTAAGASTLRTDIDTVRALMLHETLKSLKQKSKNMHKSIDWKGRKFLYLEDKNDAIEVKFEENHPINLSQNSKETNGQKLKLNLEPLKVKHELGAGNEKDLTESKCEMKDSMPRDNSMNSINNFTTAEEPEQNLDVKSSIVKQESSSKNDMIVSKSKIHYSMPTDQDSKDIDKQKRITDMISLQVKQGLSSENENDIIKTKSEMDYSMPMSQNLQDIDERKLNLNLIAPKVNDVFFSEKESTGSKSEMDYSMPMSQNLQDIDERKLNLNLIAPKVNDVSSSEKESDSMRIGQDSNDIAEERELNLDLKSSIVKQETRKPCLGQIDSKVKREFSSENESILAESKSDVSKCAATSKNSILSIDEYMKKQIDELFSTNESKLAKPTGNSKSSKGIERQKLNFELEVLKPKEELSSENKSELAKSKPDGTEYTQMLQCPKSIEVKPNSDLNAPKLRHKFSSENDSKFAKSTAISKSFEDIDEQNLDSDLKATELQHYNSSKNKIELAKSKPEGNACPKIMDSFKDADKQILNLNLKTSKEEQKITETEMENDGFTSLLQDSNTMVIKERKISTENQSKFNEFKTKECDELVILREDASLHFEFDQDGNKNIIINGKKQYTVDNKGLSFTIGEGNVLFSFVDNQVSICTEREDIDCTIGKNQVVLSLKNSSTPLDSQPECPSTNEFFLGKFTEVVEDLGSTNTTAETKDGFLLSSEEMHLENKSEKATESVLGKGSCLIPSSMSQQKIHSKIMHRFLRNVTAVGNNFDSEIRKSLNQRNKDIQKIAIPHNS